MKAKVVRAPPSRGWHQWFSYCCFTSWPVTNIKQMVEDSTESASVNLLIYSMWQNSPVFIPTHYTARNTVIQKGGGGPVMLPVFKIVQIVLRPARHNSIFTVLACIFYSVLHILILYLLSLLAKLAFCFALLCIFWHFLHISLVYCQETPRWHRCPCPFSAKCMWASFGCSSTRSGKRQRRYMADL